MKMQPHHLKSNQIKSNHIISNQHKQTGPELHAADTARDQVPALQAVQVEGPFIVDEPAPQTTHVDDDVAPTRVDHHPAVHALHAILEEAPTELDHVPALQLVQIDDAAEDQVPLPQLEHTVGKVAPDLVDHSPALHPTQTLDDVDPNADDHVPAMLEHGRRRLVFH